MTDPRDALLAEAARLIGQRDCEDNACPSCAWLARYEADRAGRGDAIDEAEQRGAERERAECLKAACAAVANATVPLTLKRRGQIYDAVSNAIAARTAPATPGKEEGE